MALKLETNGGSITLVPEAGSTHVTVTVPRAGFTVVQPAIAVTLKTAQETQTIETTDTAFGTGLAATITPKFNGSHFKITVRAFCEVNEAYNAVVNIQRNGARINQGLHSGSAFHGLSMPTQTYSAGSDNNSTPEMISFSTIDTTGSSVGVPITFALVWSANQNRTAWINRCFGAPSLGHESGTSEIIVEEIPQ